MQAVSDSQIAISFKEPLAGKLALSQVVDIDLELLGEEQNILLPSGGSVAICLQKEDVHDLRLPSGHGADRFPSIARRRGKS